MWVARDCRSKNWVAVLKCLGNTVIASNRSFLCSVRGPVILFLVLFLSTARQILVYVFKLGHKRFSISISISNSAVTLLKMLAQAITLLTCILEVPGSNFGRDTTTLRFFLWFSSVSPGKCHDSRSARIYAPTASFHIHSNSLFTYYSML
jgi:hypothetical protein